MIKFWHFTSSSCLQTVRDGRKTLVSVFNPDSTHFTSAGTDMDVIVYDTETKKRISTMQPRCVSDDRRRLASNLADNGTAVARQIHRPVEPNLIQLKIKASVTKMQQISQKLSKKYIPVPLIPQSILKISLF